MAPRLADVGVVNGASIATTFLNHHIRSRQNAIAKNLLPHGCKIGPTAGRWRRSLRNNAGNHLIALAKFHGLAGTQPRLQPLSVTKLANVHARHKGIVPQFVAHCQMPIFNNPNASQQKEELKMAVG
jgi:hypothetical protein